MRATLKKIARPAVAWMGGQRGRLLKNTLNQALTGFIFHDVSRSCSEQSAAFGLWVSPESFYRQMIFIKENFQVVGLDDLLAGKTFKRPALITFDDSFKGYFTQAVPILKELNLPSTIFLNMATVRGEPCFSGIITYLCAKDPQFLEYLKSQVPADQWKPPYFLLCRQEVVEAYLKQNPLEYAKIQEFVGEFASIKDLEGVREDPLVTFGNHLYNHAVCRLLSDEQFKETYNQNAQLLAAFPNYRPVFSFPFGQPDSCFEDRQIDLVRQWGGRLVFYSSGTINKNSIQPVLDRIPLEDFHRTPVRIWHQLFRKY